ncbi:SPOR domain-containing protein [Endozoicomonas elysicola]|uniref:SPOR domain-containing protein n=1 Tax=Endozoicomonas elysicola TaxID=305900 RepID=A0A081K5H4_9GAMM|nr:hypothetical protein [Endozoicomonas elysicola]KEI69400.1 hypothetical protein GV64_00410 [Endozoicomonas elysicola]
MPGQLLFKEKQLRLCIVAALSSMAAPVAEGLLLPPKPLASNLSWSCQSGISNDWLCNSISRQSYKSKANLQYAERLTSELPDSKQPSVNSYSDTYQPLPIEVGDSESLVSFLEAPGNHYVLQWMAAKERGQLEALKQRYPVLQNATIAQYKRSGKVWYVLLDGPYPSRIAAMAELDTPPRSHMARELYPWTRSLASIQKLDIIRPKYPAEQLAETYQPEYPSELPVHESNNTPINYDISYSTEENTQLSRYQQQAHYSQQTRPEASPDNNYPSVQPEYGKRQSVDDVMPYGSEFSSSTYSDFNSDQSYRILPEQANPQEMYVSITPAYRSRIPQQHLQKDVDYNVQDIPVSAPSEYREQRVYEEPELPRPSINVLTANPKSYTIEWMNASRKASLERARLRYSELQNTQIIHYKRSNRNRYALVSMLFVNRSDALDALLTPSLSRVSARFSPKVRQVAWLQSLVGSIPQATHAWAKPRVEPSIHKRQWIGQEDPGEKTYIVSRTGLNQRPIDTRLVDSYKVDTPTVHQQMVTHESPNGDQTPRTGGAYQPDNTYEQSDSHKQINTLLNSPENSYTIQWFSSSNRQSIEKLKQRFPELASAVTVHIQRNQKDWYVLVQGQYRSSQDAIMALKSPAMKNIAMVLHPWTRPLQSLKKMQIASL